MLPDWEEVKLGDHVDLLTGFPFKSAGFSSNEDDIPLVKGENLHQGYINWDIAKKWNKQEIDRYQKFLLKQGDVVLAMDRPWIEAGLKFSWIKKSDPECLLVQRVARMRGIDGLTSGYLRLLIGSQTFTNYIKPIVTGVNVPHISPAQIRDFKFSLPPIGYQNSAYEIISAYDDLIENNQRRIRILEDMAQSLYREWFVHFRFPGHEKIKMIASPLGPIPQGWEVRELKQCVSFVKEATKPERLKPHYKYLPIDCLPRKSLSVSEHRPLEEAQSSLVLFKREDILFGAMRPYFHKVVIAPFDGVTRATCFVFRPLTEEYRCWSLLQLYQDETVDYANAHSKGATIPYASWEDGMARMPVIFPPSEIAQKFEEAISASVEKIINTHHRQESLKNARDLLLAKLISGEINLSAAASEFAEAA